MELVVPELMGIVGEDSKTAKVLKLIHQNVILYCVSVLKDSVCSGILTKDVRTPNGWRVGIELTDNIQVWHVRREQSVDMWGDTRDHFEFEFEARAVFDAEMQDLRAATLRIIALDLADSMDPARKLELRQQLIGDLLVT